MFSNGEVVEGHNYGNIVSTAGKLSMQGEKIYGFVTSYGDFVLPYEAAVIALKAGQISSVTDELKPEDLWPQWAED